MNTRELPVYYLKPGELHIDDQPGIVTTVLGSCVSVTMFNRRREMGAICHGLMPEQTEKQRSGKQGDDGFKYVDYSIKYMIDHFRSFGIAPGEIEVKLFGGADMFSMSNGGSSYASVGAKNIHMALLMMEQEGLTIQTKDIGGTQGRKLHFYTHTGEVFLKRLRRSETSRIIRLQTEAGRSEGGQFFVVPKRRPGSDRAKK